MQNLLLISIDSLRADTCGFLNDSGVTPYLSELAKEGTVFENAIAPGPRTPSSLPPMFTGEFYRHEYDSVIGRRTAIDFHLSTHQTIPEQLSDIGYTTVGFTANPWTAKDTGFNKGFDEFYELNPNSNNNIETLVDSPVIRGTNTLLEAFGRENMFGWQGKREWFTHWTVFLDQIKDKISELAEPYFVWIFLMDSHQPYIVPSTLQNETNWFKMYYSLLRFWRDRDTELPPHAIKWMRQSYRDAARSADEFVRRLYDSIRGSNINLVVHSDHGESHGEHGTYGHEYRLYEENIRIPLLIHGDTYTERIVDPVSLTSLPSIIESTCSNELTTPESFAKSFVYSGAESRSISTLRGNMLDYSPHDFAVRGKRYKYISAKDDEELYDLKVDPDETTDISGKYTEITKNLRQLAAARMMKPIEKKKIVSSINKSNL
ncbi:sulfatase-like hydrolase/transferase [Haladaptatus halobius]|uniref:sulfatase-like hydrolase/transferase n=1 Tax=Haladaptatus halobius TaxID=2884875 RepID=UPI001D0A6C8B|nr:sulfatase-like hydrolase/transferase [Haladaptatus halobius]